MFNIKSDCQNTSLLKKFWCIDTKYKTTKKMYNILPN